MNTNNTDELVGTIDRFLFQNPDNGYTVLLLQVPRSENVTVKGYMPNINPGQQITIQGSWVMHPKFGKQFEATHCTAALPTSSTGLQKYLASGMIKGIGPKYAEKLVAYFGNQVLEVIDKNPERLQEVSGIGAGRAQKITQAWHDHKEISNVMIFLQEKGISPAYAIKIYKMYGQNSIAIIQENPYRLADELWGIGFKTADKIAHNLGIAKDSLQRIRAGILYTISTATSSGHLYCELQKLKDTTRELLELDAQPIDAILKNALHDLYEGGKIKLVTYQNEHFISLAQGYFSEKGVATKIARIKEYPAITCNLNDMYAKLRAPQHEKDICLNDEQQQGVLACLQNKITIITGGPGTGKTTLIKKLLGLLDEQNIVYKLAAPTGRAAKRITEGTGRHASTIHRLLEYDFMSRSFAHNEENALKLHFLIIDEASMIDIFLAHGLLKALPLHAHLVLIGDVDQLPSVGAGNFLNDLIASETVTCIRLKQIFRQAQDSLIIVNAHRVNNGEFPSSFLPDAKRDFIYIKEENAENVQQHLTSIFTQQLSRYGIPTADAVVLTPMNRGIVGTQKINHDLQTILNPITTEKQLSYAGTIFKIGDRVMQIRNNYDKLVFNGDSGTIDDIDMQDRIMKVSYGDRIVEYESNEIDELVLAYAITIHKSQGSEYSAVIIPLFMQHFTLLQRNLLYTAITRAKKLCILIGQPKAIGMAIGNNKGVERTTFLQQYLTSDLQCR